MTSQIDFQILALESAIETLQDKINELRGDTRIKPFAKTEAPTGKKRGRKPGTTLSVEARRRIQEAQRKRWDLARRQAGAPQTEAAETPETAVAVGQTTLPPVVEEAPEAPPPQPRRGRPARGSKGRD